MNTLNRITVYELFILDRNTWYHIIVCKEMSLEKNFTKGEIFLNSIKIWNYSYDYNQTFTN